jgi:signal transduction histidine kinase/CheY-like chemotaxis protein
MAREGSMTVGNDIDPSVALERANERAALFESIIQSMGESVLVVDRDGKEVYANKELYRFRGEVREGQDLNTWRNPEVMKISDAYGVELPPEQWPVARALRGDYADSFEIRVRGMAHRPGETVLSISTRSLVDVAGQIVGAVIVTRDITSMTVVLGNSEILAERLADQPALRQLAETTLTVAERGAELTHRLLAFSRRQPLVPKSVEVNALIAGMRELLQRTLSEQVEVRVEASEGLWSALVDSSQLESAVLNLCINARDAMPQGGRLTIETANVYLDENYAAQHSELDPGEFVMIAVSDTGVGIAAENLGKVFEPFFTTKEVGKGTGLGLSMVYGFVKQSRGHVRVYSEQGIGTVVKMFLPRSERTPDVFERQATLLTNLRGSERILLVEDDDFVRAHAERVLEALGYDVTAAPNGPAALELLRGDGAFDLLFTDIVMPGGMTGKILAEQAVTMRPSLKVLYASGYTQKRHRSRRPCR